LFPSAVPNVIALISLVNVVEPPTKNLVHVTPDTLHVVKFPVTTVPKVSSIVPAV